MDGWFKVYRGWMDNPVFKDDKERLCWMWLLEKAAWQDTYHNVGESRHKVPRGSMFITHRTISHRFSWSLTKVKNFLLRLEKEDMIQYKIKTKKSHITICNYDKYQQTKDKLQSNIKSESGTLNKKLRNKEENRDFSDDSKNYLQWERFRDTYKKIPKPNWSSRDETVFKYFDKAVSQDGEEVVLSGTEEYSKLCIQKNRPAYNPVKFLRERKYLSPKSSAGVTETENVFKMFQ